jgi:hypothetical protein
MFGFTITLRHLLFIAIHGGLLYFNPHDLKETPMYQPSVRIHAPVSARTRRASYSAYKALWKWSRRDLFRVGDSFENVGIPGETGSAKTSTSLIKIVQAYAEAGYGGLLMGPKANFVQIIEDALSSAGALNRSIRLCPGHYGINLIRATAEGQDGLEENIVDLIFSGGEVVTRTMGVGHGDPFWIIAARSVGKKLIVLDQADNGSVDVRRMLAMCRSIPRSLQDLVVDDDGQNKRAVLATIERVREKYPPGADYAIDDAINYITVEAPNMGEKALGSVIATLTAYLEPWCDEIVYNAVCKDSGTWKLSDIREKGLIVISDYPLKKGWEKVGAVIGAALKRAVQRQIERELTAGHFGLRPVMFVLDDAGCYANTDDVNFLQTGREACAAVVWAFHSISVLRDQFGGTDVALNKVKALLTFFRTLIVHQLDDEETGKYLSGRGGEHWVKKDGWNWGESKRENGKPQISEGSNSQYVSEPWVKYWSFARLKRGGERNGGVAKAIVMRSEHFKHGDRPYLKIKLVQEPIYHGEDDPPKSWKERINRWRHRFNHFLGRSVFIWTDLTPRFRIWNGHVPFYKVGGWLFLKPEKGKRLLERWIYFWLDEREVSVWEEAKDDSRH